MTKEQRLEINRILFQAISSAVIFFISPFLNIVTYGVILLLTCTAGAVGFHFAGRQVERREAEEAKHSRDTVPEDVEHIVERGESCSSTSPESERKHVVGAWSKIRPLEEDKAAAVQKY